MMGGTYDAVCGAMPNVLLHGSEVTSNGMVGGQIVRNDLWWHSQGDIDYIKTTVGGKEVGAYTNTAPVKGANSHHVITGNWIVCRPGTDCSSKLTKVECGGGARDNQVQATLEMTMKTS